jgi:hypothetical protein
MARPKKQISLAEFGLNQNLISQIQDLRRQSQVRRNIAWLRMYRNGTFTRGIEAEPELKHRYE